MNIAVIGLGHVGGWPTRYYMHLYKVVAYDIDSV